MWNVERSRRQPAGYRWQGGRFPRSSGRTLVVAAVLAVASALAGGQAGAEAGDAEIQGRLVGLPSVAGPHLEKIKALGDNEWLELGPPSPDPQWGVGRGRSWSAKMAYAPDLRGAFLVGQGRHGYIKPDGRYDDIFFYDLNAHRWVCIFPGVKTTTFADDIRKGDYKINDDGQLVDRDGQPVLLAWGHHCYQTHTYDTDRRKWIVAWSWTGMGGAGQYERNTEWFQAGKALLDRQMEGKIDRVAGACYLFNTRTGTFERSPETGTAPGSAVGRVLEYVPTRKQVFAFSRGTAPTAFYDPATRTWTDVEAKGTPPRGGDVGGCYDSKRDRVYVCGRGHFGPPQSPDEGHISVYDVKTNTWSNLPDRGQPPTGDERELGMLGSSNRTCTHYDSAGDRVILIRFSKDGSLPNEVCAFDPEAGVWEAPLPIPAGVSGARRNLNGFYSPQVNAHFIHLAGDSSDNGTIWAYRYKRTLSGRTNR